MAGDFEYDEDGNQVYRPSPEEIEETLQRVNTLVDCKALAQEIIERSDMPDQAFLQEISRAHGIDGTKTLTEIEGEDYGDAYDEADEAIVHALRYVPVARWDLADLRLMIAYGHGINVAMVLAECYLRKSPMLEAEYHAGDLLELFSREAHGAGKAGIAKEFADRFENSVWDEFDNITEQLDLNSEEVGLHRTRLEHGRRSDPGKNYFLDIENHLETLAKIKDHIDPPKTIATAKAKQLFAHYRPRKSTELVPLPDLENVSYKTKIDDPDTFKFRRETKFTVVEDPKANGVRLRIFSDAAIDHRPGIWFATTEDAMETANRDFGVLKTDWT